MSAELMLAGLFVIVLLWVLWLWLSRSGPGRAVQSVDDGPAEPGSGRMFEPMLGEQDDLTRIKGIGKVIAAKLNALGVTTFRQIASFDAEDIQKVDAVLDFKGRIQREKWVEQAQNLDKVKH